MFVTRIVLTREVSWAHMRKMEGAVGIFYGPRRESWFEVQE